MTQQLRISDSEHLDAIERRMLASLPVVDMPVDHLFTPNLYRRTITMPPGSLLTSKIHRTQHPYVVLRGMAFVLVAGQKAEFVEAGDQGVTQPGTRRALFIPEDSEPCVWATFHPLTEQEEAMRLSGASVESMVAAIEARVIEPHRHADGLDVHKEYLRALADAGVPLMMEAAA